MQSGLATIDFIVSTKSRQDVLTFLWKNYITSIRIILF